MKPITLTLQASLKLTILLTLASLFFSVMLLVVPLPFVLKTLLVFFILLMAIYYILRDALLKLPTSPKVLRLNSAGEWSFTQLRGSEITVNIASDSYVSAYLTVLHFIPLDNCWYKILQHRYIILLRDNVQADLFRVLRVNLLWGSQKKETLQTKEN